jgi:hypothetical protein
MTQMVNDKGSETAKAKGDLKEKIKQMVADGGLTDSPQVPATFEATVRAIENRCEGPRRRPDRTTTNWIDTRGMELRGLCDGRLVILDDGKPAA